MFSIPIFLAIFVESALERSLMPFAEISALYLNKSGMKFENHCFYFIFFVKRKWNEIKEVGCLVKIIQMIFNILKRHSCGKVMAFFAVD